MRKQRETETPQNRAKRLHEGAEVKGAARKAEEAKLQGMIERSIQEHGA